MKRLIGLLLIFEIGCAARHVKLAPPPLPDAPAEERLEAYKDLKPLVHPEVYSVGQYGGTALVHNSLTLGNGMRVYHPEDLLPVIGQDTNLRFK